MKIRKDHCIILTICLAFVILCSIVFCIANARADIVYIQGIPFDIKNDSEIMRRYKAGENTFIIVRGEAIPVKMVKACEYTEPGEDAAYQKEETDEKGNTVYIYIDPKTDELVDDRKTDS